jgi:phosphopantetheinyl transferase (holo-ACP synthase)
VAVAAVVAVTEGPSGVGIDVEGIRALPWSDAASVIEEAEEAAARDLDLDPTVLWSAKEAAFKAWSHACGAMPSVDPIDMRVRIEPGAGKVRVDAVGSLGRHLDLVGVSRVAEGKMMASDRILTLVRVP